MSSQDELAEEQSSPRAGGSKRGRSAAAATKSNKRTKGAEARKPAADACAAHPRRVPSSSPSLTDAMPSQPGLMRSRSQSRRKSSRAARVAERVRAPPRSARRQRSRRRRPSLRRRAKTRAKKVQDRRRHTPSTPVPDTWCCAQEKTAATTRRSQRPRLRKKRTTRRTKAMRRRRAMTRGTRVRPWMNRISSRTAVRCC